MAEASYERQHLAVHAAGFINAAGTTIITFGCAMTKIASGHFALLLDANSGLVNDESFTLVTPKGGSQRIVSVLDTAPQQKDIFVRDGANSAADCDLEVALFKSVTH
jgi:hypothetical protein